MSGLGRLVPPDFDHVEKYPLSALPAEAKPATHVPVVIGVNWYEGFDQPEVERHSDGDIYWIGRGPMGNIRGGHCVCLEPARDPEVKGSEQDDKRWWEFYDQGQEGACVGFGSTRMMTLMNRHRYDAFWLYHEAQRVGGYEGQEGAYVRDALKVLQTEGHRVTHLDGDTDRAKASEGINAYRWATSVDQVLDALGTPGLGYVTVLNSWGVSYPQRVRLPAEILHRLINESGEIGLVTDR
jgi:hypothetical protein